MDPWCQNITIWPVKLVGYWKPCSSYWLGLRKSDAVLWINIKPSIWTFRACSGSLSTKGWLIALIPYFLFHCRREAFLFPLSSQTLFGNEIAIHIFLHLINDSNRAFYLFDKVYLLPVCLLISLLPQGRCFTTQPLSSYSLALLK